MGKSYAGGPGTQVRGGVCTPMDAPFGKSSNKGSQTGMAAPFDKARSGGDNGLPTRVTDTLGGARKGPKPTQVGPSQQGPRRKGQE